MGIDLVDFVVFSLVMVALTVETIMLTACVLWARREVRRIKRRI